MKGTKRVPNDLYVGVYERTSEKKIHKKRPDVCFDVSYKKNGKKIWEKIGWLSEGYSAKAASLIRADRIQACRHGEELPRERKKGSTFGQLAKVYFTHYEGIHGHKPKIDEGRYKTHIKEYLDDKRADQIDPLTIDRIRIEMKKASHEGSVYNVLELIRRILNFAFSKRLIKALPVKIKIPKRNNEKTEHLTPEELVRLLKVLNEYPDIQITNIFKLALFTGMRKGEILKLEWRDVDLRNRFINLRDPKGGIDEKIPMNDSAFALLSKHPRTADGSYVFPGEGGQKRYDVKNPSREIRKLAELPEDFRPLHGLRHSYASMLASSGKVDIYTISRLLTHKDVRTTKRYAHLSNEALQRATNILSEIVENNGTAELKVIEMKE